jgi:glycosyltransferase involved in cell wall biosynthesis
MSTSSLRILQLCHKPPRPSVDGGCLAMDSLTMGLLSENHQVKVVCLHTHKHPFNPELLDGTYIEHTGIEAVFAETELNLRDAASHVITGESYHLSRFHVPRMERVIERIMRTEYFDIIILESLFMSSYIPAIRRLTDADIVLRAHNVEHRIWSDVTQDMSGPKKWLLQLFQRKLQKAELEVLQQVDAVATISEVDTRWFREHEPSREGGSHVVTIPFGLDVQQCPHQSMGTPPNHVLHLGAMDWAPNIQGVSWFVEEVWPRVRAHVSDVELTLAGRNMPESWVSDDNRGLHVVGEVEDARSTYDTPCVVVVPLHAGSGMRIKLAEALAAGRPIVTTTKGMEGLDLTHEEQVLVGDNAEDMSAHVCRLLQDPDFAVKLGARGRDWALKHLDHTARARQLTTFLDTLVDA